MTKLHGGVNSLCTSPRRKNTTNRTLKTLFQILFVAFEQCIINSKHEYLKSLNILILS